MFCYLFGVFIGVEYVVLRENCRFFVFSYGINFLFRSVIVVYNMDVFELYFWYFLYQFRIEGIVSYCYIYVLIFLVFFVGFKEYYFVVLSEVIVCDGYVRGVFDYVDQIVSSFGKVVVVDLDIF